MKQSTKQQKQDEREWGGFQEMGEFVWNNGEFQGGGQKFRVAHSKKILTDRDEKGERYFMIVRYSLLYVEHYRCTTNHSCIEILPYQ
jgi:hypothetical protein